MNGMNWNGNVPFQRFFSDQRFFSGEDRSVDHFAFASVVNIKMTGSPMKEFARYPAVHKSSNHGYAPANLLGVPPDLHTEVLKFLRPNWSPKVMAILRLVNRDRTMFTYAHRVNETYSPPRHSEPQYTVERELYRKRNGFRVNLVREPPVQNFPQGRFAVQKRIILNSIDIGGNESPWNEIECYRATQHAPHPHILRMQNYYCSPYQLPTDLVITLDYANSNDLFSWIFETEIPPPPQVFRSWFIQICHGLRHLHSCGWTNLDLSPENILIHNDAPPGEPPLLRPVLMDFGAALPIGTSHFSFRGKHRFAAPELYCNPPFNAARCDMWSLGILLYMLLARNVPFERATPFACEDFKEFKKAHTSTKKAWENLDEFLVLSGRIRDFETQLKKVREASPSPTEGAACVAWKHGVAVLEAQLVEARNLIAISRRSHEDASQSEPQQVRTRIASQADPQLLQRIIEDGALDLVQRLLRYDPLSRITPNGVLAHSYCTLGGEGDNGGDGGDDGGSGSPGSSTTSHPGPGSSHAGAMLQMAQKVRPPPLSLQMCPSPPPLP
jgi:serine/threonine protein kinase